MLRIDGSQKSGSGTIVRYSVALASLFHQDLELINIRSKREEKPGLRPQHLKAIQACAEITKGKLEKAQIGANHIRYFPGEKINGGKYEWDIGTAGSTTMLVQTVLPLACFADSPSLYRITGGLFQDFAPAAHHLQQVIFPLLKKMGIKAQIKILRPGYVPTGEGIIEITVHPLADPILPLTLLEQGKIITIKGIALSSHLKEAKVSERMATTCKKNLEKLTKEIDIAIVYDETAKQKGASLTTYLHTTTGCILGEDMAGKRGRTSEYIGKKVAEMLIEDFSSKATVDRFTADQLILYCSLAKGISTYVIPKMTDHIETNLWLIEKIVKAKVSINNNKISIQGINFVKSKKNR